MRFHWQTSLKTLALLAMAGAVAVGFGQSTGAELTGVDRKLDPVIEARVSALLEKMTLDEKIDFIGGEHAFRMHAIPQLGIPAFQMADGPLGAHIPAPTIAYAGGIGLAASWDRDLAFAVGTQLGRDAKSRGGAYLLGPGVNIYRTPLNGRNFEYFGEDPFLGSAIAVGYIRGVQSEHVSATVKHFLGNNSEFGRHSTNSVIDERALREIYLPIFEASVKEAKVGAIMDSYNLTNGSHMTENSRLNIEVAKKEWGFAGIIMSDWNSIYNPVAAFNGGLDLEMPYSDNFSREHVHAELDAGQITEATLNDKVRRLLRVAISFGWLDHPQLDDTIPRYNLQGKAVSHRAVLEGAVLLKNDNHTLPLRADTLHKLAVIGPNAALVQTTGGGSGEVVSFAPTSLMVGLSNALAGKADVLYSRGLYTSVQLARLTRFTTGAEGKTSGVTHEVFSTVEPQGTPQQTMVEQGMTLVGTTRREPEEQEINALNSTLAQSAYNAGQSSNRWTGFYNAEEDQDYLVFAQTERRYKLMVDGNLVIDNTPLPKMILSQVHLHLSKGPHKIEMDQLAATRSGGLRFSLLVGIVPVKSLVDPQTLALAAKADAIVLSVGFNNTSETEGGDRGFDLTLGQDELISQVAALGKKTIVVINAGGSVNISPWKDKVGAIFQAWYPGEDGGAAMAELILGQVSPSGHLPISWEAQLSDNPSFANYYPAEGSIDIPYREGIFVGYRGYEHVHKATLYPFGYGLSYTRFEFSDLKANVDGPGHVTVTFKVKNVGEMEGAAVGQVYVAEEHPTVERPEKELKGFGRVQLRPGETQVVSVKLDPRSFSFFDTNTSTWKADAGVYDIELGENSESIAQKTSVKLSEAITTPVTQ